MTDRRGISFFAAKDGTPLLEDGIMSGPDISTEVFSELDLSKLIAGDATKVLFKGDGGSGFSLVHAKFRAGYRLPRHTHSGDCLYYVVAGEAHMGNRVIPAGDGFFVPDGAPYTYEAGPDGVEVLEFRTVTSFDMKIADADNTVERWRPIVEAAEANQSAWLAAAQQA